MPRRPSTPITAPAVHAASRSSTKVIVACKLAVPRFELQLCQKRMVTEQTQAGPREVPQYFKTGEIHIVRGTAYPEGTPPKGFIKRPEEVLGYALTKGIPKEFWDKWLEQYGQTDMVKNRLIYACDTYDEIEEIANENADVKCALAPLDMPASANDKPDGRVPAPVQTGVSTIERMQV